MTKGRIIFKTITMMVVAGLIVFIVNLVSELNSKTQYYNEIRNNFITEVTQVSKLSQIFRLEKISSLEYGENILTVTLSDTYKETGVGAKVSAKYEINGENVKFLL
ncbi:MAG: hypothetical protein FWF46_04555 [Oscillospiraceae bacterium]|nr:hypothetical protein [Oscillospiraceae bacterium]